MKNKIVLGFLSVALLVSIASNVWQFNNANNIKSNINSVQTEINGLNENMVSLDNDIATKKEEIATLSTKVTDLENQIETLQTDNESLMAELSDDEYQGDNPYDTGVEITDDISTEDWAQQIIADYMKEHAQDNQIEVEIPGATPGDPSQDKSGIQPLVDDPAGAGVTIQ